MRPSFFLPLLLLPAACAVAPPLQAPVAGEAPIAEAGVAFARDRELGSFALGLADPKSGRAVTPDDPVRVASISKVAVAIGVMRLVEQGRLDL
ncbi:MAG TPA: serine hydrolase, partial [Sphingomicrobium sp.]|nr:serine hydrolase [Sphingomicrobium sp.]